MAQDYYKTLGIARNASQADIQKAYRDLARKHHPDMNPDNPKAVKKFQEVQAAFDVLNNTEKREMYDRYGSSFETMGQGAPQGAGGAWGPPPGGFTAEDIDFSQFFGDRFGEGEGAGLGDVFTHFRKGGARSGGAKRRGSDVASEATIAFTVAVSGGEVQLGLHRENGQTETIVVKIPAGIEDGKKMRLRGKGEPAGGRGGTAGDLLLTIHIAPHPFFSRKGNDLYVRLPVTLGEAVAGASIDVPTPQGTVALHIPPGTSSGKRLRVKGHGVPGKNATGDLFAEVLIVLPPKMSDADREAIRAIDARSPSNPRQNLRW